MTAFFASAECPEDIEDGTAEICAQAVFDEQVAFFSRENARAAGFKVAKHVHPYRPTSELSLDERKKRMEAVKKKSTCKACGEVGHWARNCPARHDWWRNDPTVPCEAKLRVRTTTTTTTTTPF